MNSVHDMGGMHGLGPISPLPAEPLFHHDWESRVLAMNIASPTRSNIDAGRHQRELIPGPEYLAMTYYEKWFRGLSERLMLQGFATAEELASGHAAPGAARATPRLLPDGVPAAMTRPGSYVREVSNPPLFAPGDRVRALNLNPTGHTRLPRYARGRWGEIVSWYGAHVYPDSHAHDRGETPHHLYCVSFSARELWGPDAPARDSVRLDLWEPYLERA